MKADHHGHQAVSEATCDGLAANAEWVPLRDLCEARTGVGDPSARPNEEFWYVDISAIDNQSKRITAPKRLLGKDAPSRARNVIRARDILVATTRPNLNAVALVPLEFDNQIASTGFCVLRAGPRISSDYLFKFVQCGAFIEPLSDLVKGALYPAVNDSQVLALEIPLPPVAEQERIAARLGGQLECVERARAAAQSRLAAAEALPAAYLGDALNDRKWPRIELGTGLKAIEAGTSVQSLERRALTDEWGVLKVSAVSWGRYRPEESKAIPDAYTPKPHEHVCSGDLLISRANTAELAGAVVLVRDAPPKRMLSDKTLRLVLREDVFAAEFLEHALRTRSARKFIEANATGTSYSMRNISQKVIRAIPVAAPPVADQHHIATALAQRLAAAERVAQSARAQLAAIDALPAALLREAFGDTK